MRVRKGFIDGLLDHETAKRAIREAEADLEALPKAHSAPLHAGQMLTDIRELWP